MAPFQAQFAEITAPEVVRALSSVLPEIDRVALTDEFGEEVALGFREAVKLGVGGWLHDDLASVQPWGFALGEVTVSTFLWQGEADLMVSFAHGRWLASQILDVLVHLERGEGHLSIRVGAMERTLDELASVL